VSLDVDQLDSSIRGRDHFTARSHGLEVEDNRFPNATLDLRSRFPRGHAARQFGHVGSPVPWRLLIDDGVFHLRSSSRPDWLRILRQVPRGRSSLGLPETVTVPGRSRCWSWRWLPLRRTSTQPAARNRRSASLTFSTAQTCGRGSYDSITRRSLAPAARLWEINTRRPTRGDR